MRQRLLDRLGLFGVRLAVELIVAGRVDVDRRAGRRARAAQRHRRAAPHPRRPVRVAGRRCSRPARRWRRCRRSPTCTAGRKGGSCATRSGTSSRPPTSSSRSGCCPSCGRDPSGLGDDGLEARRILGDDGPDPHVRLGLAADGDRRRRARGGDHGDRAVARGRRGPAARAATRATSPSGVVRTCEALAVAGRADRASRGERRP